MRTWKTKVIFLPAGLVFVLCACAKIHPVSTDIFHEDNLQVKLVEERDRSDAAVPKGFDHPWEVDRESLERLLASISYQKNILLYKGKPKRAFPENELETLLPHLQKAFSSASPDQYVDFSFVHKKSWTILQRRYLTDGLLFRKGQRLHCAFRNIAFEDQGRGDDGYGPYTEDPTVKPVYGDWTFILGQGQRLEYADKPGLLGSKTYPNWIELDLSLPPTPSQAGSTVKEAPKVLTTPPAGAQTGGEMQRGVLLEEGATPALSRKEIEEKLQFLDELKRQGLLSPASYDEKRKELLRALEALPPNP
jgi:hypothetical protein